MKQVLNPQATTAGYAEDYGAFTDVIWSIGGSVISLFWRQPYSFVLLFLLAPFYCNQTNPILFQIIILSGLKEALRITLIREITSSFFAKYVQSKGELS